MQNRFLTTLLSFLLFANHLFADDIYVKYDPAKSDRYEYRLTDKSGENSFVAYRFGSADNGQIVFEVGMEENTYQSQLNGTLLNIKDLVLNEQFVQEVNRGSKSLYIVQQDKKGYRISLVILGNYLKQNASGELALTSADYHFSFKEGIKNVGTNLASEESESYIYFTQTDKNTCRNTYYFKEIPKDSNKPFTEFSLMPEIGVISEKTGFSGEEAEQNKLELVSINNIQIDEYLKDFCAGKNMRPQNGASDEPIVKSPTSKNKNKNQPEDVLAARSGQTVNCEGVRASANQYILQKGESLYAVSRKTGVSLEKLRTYNNILPNAILQPCQIISLTGGGSPQSAADEFTDKGGSPKIVPEWKKETSGFYYIKKGDSVESLSKKLGYTEERLRFMNDMEEEEEFTTGKMIRISDCACSAETPSPKATEKKMELKEKSVPVDRFTPRGVPEKTITTGKIGKKTYTVESNETLQSIAKKFKITVEKLRELNNLDNKEVVIPGQKIIVE